MPCVADWRALEDDIEGEDRGDEYIHGNRAPEHPDQDAVLGPLHHGDGNTAFHDTGEDHVDDFEKPDVLNFVSLLC